MTYSPQTLKDLASYIVSQGVVNLGVVGDTAHLARGTSYHLGQSQLQPGAYSAIVPRDREPHLTEAASAIDLGKVGGTIQGLQKLSIWLARECASKAADTLDIREVIWSPDGTKVSRWDREGIPPTTGSSSHLTHTHISYYRDSETRDKRALFRRYFEEAEVKIAFKIEQWTLDGAGKITTLGAPYKADGVTIDWTQRLTYSLAPALLTFVARSRLTDPDASQDVVLRKALSDYARQPAGDCTAAILAARQSEWDRIVPSVTAVLPPRP